jgi:hypothetical protein
VRDRRDPDRRGAGRWPALRGRALAIRVVAVLIRPERAQHERACDHLQIVPPPRLRRRRFEVLRRVNVVAHRFEAERELHPRRGNRIAIEAHGEIVRGDADRAPQLLHAHRVEHVRSLSSDTARWRGARGIDALHEIDTHLPRRLDDHRRRRLARRFHAIRRQRA